MKSIRVFLVVAVLSVMTLTTFLASLHGYRSSIALAEDLFDKKLEAITYLLDDLIDSNDIVRDLRAFDKITRFQKADLIFQIWGEHDDLILGTEGIITPLAPLKEGYYFENHRQYRWRIRVHHKPQEGIWILVGERADVRYQLAENIILESILPVIISLPIAALFIWWVIGNGLSVLTRLASDLRSRQPDDLQPLIYETLPEELEPVLLAINRLFQRLEMAFQREKNFAADAAHELRTPISALKVHVYNINNNYPELTHALSILNTDLDRLEHLVEQVLILYRTNPDTSEFFREGVDLEALCQEAVSDIYPSLESKRQNIELQASPCAPIFGNRYMLQAMISNLLVNAHKYSPAGGDIKLTLSQNRNHIILNVVDDGDGIPESDYGRVFDRFYRVGGDRHASSEFGCGLGLAIVKHVIDLHRGDIHFRKQSLEDSKTVFVVQVSFPASYRGSLPEKES